MEFRPKHKDFVGIDSDGCVFDSMELKQKECFIPNIVKSWNLQAVSNYVRETAEFVNLYSKWRGTNRFPALVKTFELLRERPEVKRRAARVPGMSSLQKFIHSGVPLGNPTLREAIARENDPELKRTLEWSEAVNRDVAEMVKGLEPFPLVNESLRKLQGRADVVVVSATPGEAVRREWEEHGIDKCVSFIAGQELGRKEEQLATAAKGRYSEGHVLMVGDAFGDLSAARAVGARFYPIVPGKEEKSWEIFHRDIIELFLSNGYTRKTEAQYLEDFTKALPDIPPWSNS